MSEDSFESIEVGPGIGYQDQDVPDDFSPDAYDLLDDSNDRVPESNDIESFLQVLKSIVDRSDQNATGKQIFREMAEDDRNIIKEKLRKLKGKNKTTRTITKAFKNARQSDPQKFSELVYSVGQNAIDNYKKVLNSVNKRNEEAERLADRQELERAYGLALDALKDGEATETVVDHLIELHNVRGTNETLSFLIDKHDNAPDESEMERIATLIDLVLTDVIKDEIQKLTKLYKQFEKGDPLNHRRLKRIVKENGEPLVNLVNRSRQIVYDTFYDDDSVYPSIHKKFVTEVNNELNKPKVKPKVPSLFKYLALNDKGKTFGSKVVEYNEKLGTDQTIAKLNELLPYITDNYLGNDQKDNAEDILTMNKWKTLISRAIEHVGKNRVELPLDDAARQAIVDGEPNTWSNDSIDNWVKSQGFFRTTELVSQLQDKYKEDETQSKRVIGLMRTLTMSPYVQDLKEAQALFDSETEYDFNTLFEKYKKSGLESYMYLVNTVLKDGIEHAAVDDQDDLKEEYERFRQFGADLQFNMQQSGRTKLFRLIKQGEPIAEIQKEIARLQSIWKPSNVRKQLLNLDEYITTSNLPADTKSTYKDTLKEASNFIEDAKQPKKRVQKGSNKSKKSKEPDEIKTGPENISDVTKTNLYRVLIKGINDKKINVTPQIKAAVHKLMLSNGRDDAITLANTIQEKLTDEKWRARLAAMQFYVDTYEFTKLLRSQIPVDDSVLRESIRDLTNKNYDKDKIWKLIQVTTNQLRDKKPTANIKLAETLIKNSDNERVEEIERHLNDLKKETKSIGEQIRDLSIRDLDKYRTRLDNVKRRTPLDEKGRLSRIDRLLGDIDKIQSQMVQLRKGLLVEDRKPRKPSKKEVAAAAVDGANAQVNARRPKKKGSPRNMYEKVRQLFETEADGKARESNRLHDSARLRLADNEAKRTRYARDEEKKRTDQEDWENYQYYLINEPSPDDDLLAANDTSWNGNKDDAAANDTTWNVNEDDAAANATFWNVNDDDADAANDRLRNLEQLDVLRESQGKRNAEKEVVQKAAPKAIPKTKPPTDKQIEALLNIMLAKDYTNPKLMASGTEGTVYSMQIGSDKYAVKMQRVPDKSQFDREVQMQKEFASYGLAPIVKESTVINARGQVGLTAMPQVETLDAYLSKRREYDDLANVVQGLVTLVRNIEKHKLTHGDLTLFNTYLTKKGEVGAIDFGRSSTVFAPSVDNLRVAMELSADTRTNLGKPIEASNSDYLSTIGLTEFKEAFNIQGEPQETVRAWAAAYEKYCVAAEVPCLPSAKPTKSSAKSRK